MSSTKKLHAGEFTEAYLSEKAKHDYESGRATFEFQRRKCALIVVDMIDEFTKPNYCPAWIPDATRQLPKIKELIEFCRKGKIPVIYTCYAFDSTYTNMNPYFRNAWTPIDKFDDYDGPPLVMKESVDSQIKPAEGVDIIIAKPSYGAFTGTTLDYTLKNLGIDTVVICGTMTNYCCGTTAREAHALGYKVIFGSDINSTDDPEIQRAELKTLRRGFALVLSQKEILAALSA